MIPLYRPLIRKKEKDAVLKVFSSKKLSRGGEVEEFERSFSKYTGEKYAIAVNSGTSGLHILTRCFGWKEGDEIITTPFSYIASANAILFEKATPVFADINPRTLNIDPDEIEKKITPHTKGIVLVHALGLPADYKKIERIKKKYHLQILEDACEAVGRPSKKFPVSYLGEGTVYGFHENKQITTGGEGGIIVTDNPLLARKCRAMRDQGRSLDKHWLQKVTLGFNFRMTEMQAAFGSAQLKDAHDILRERALLAKKYSSLLQNINGITTPQQLCNANRSWFVYFIKTKDARARERVRLSLKRAGIASSTNYFPPIYAFPQHAPYRRGTFPHTEDAARTLLVLPFFNGLSDAEIKRNVHVIKKAFA